MSARKTRVSIGSKLLLVAASFALPIVALTYFVVQTIDTNIDFTLRELSGTRYQRAIAGVLDGLTQQQLQLYSCGIGTSCGPAIAETKAAVDSAFTQLAMIEAELGVELQFTDVGLAKRKRAHVKVSTVVGKWKRLAASVMLVQQGGGGVTQEISDQYEQLIVDLRTMTSHVGDTSNLILDPDLDSYYLMDVTLLALPQTQARIAKLTRLGFTVASGGSGDPADRGDLDNRMKLIIGAALMQEADIDRITSSSETSINEDENFYGASPTLAISLRPALTRYQKAAADFIAQIAPAEGKGLNTSAIVTAGMAARTASFQMWNSAVRELDDLLEVRAASLRKSKFTALAVSGVALFIACLLALLATRSITGPLGLAVRLLEPGADLLAASARRISELSHQPKASMEETAIICEELDAHADDLRKVVQGLVAHVKGGATGKA
jgi:methyl-accepting chemotaxis protein